MDSKSNTLAYYEKWLKEVFIIVEREGDGCMSVELDISPKLNLFFMLTDVKPFKTFTWQKIS
jgi:hypothetical protein